MIWAIAKMTVGDATQKKVFWVTLLVGFIFLALSVIFAFFTPHEEITIIKGTGLSIITVFGAIIAVLGTANLVPTEIERRTIYTLLSKPVQRHQFVIGKFIGAALTVMISVLSMGIILYLIVFMKTFKLNPEFFVGILMIYLQMVLLAAVTMTFSVFATPLVTISVSIFIYIVGTLSEHVESLINLTAANKMELARWGLVILHRVVPNFGNFNVNNPVIHPERFPAFSKMLPTLGFIIGQEAIYVIALLLLAVVIFQTREI